MYKMPLYTKRKSPFSNCMGNAIKEVQMCLSVTHCLPISQIRFIDKALFRTVLTKQGLFNTLWKFSLNPSIWAYKSQLRTGALVKVLAFTYWLDSCVNVFLSLLTNHTTGNLNMKMPRRIVTCIFVVGEYVLDVSVSYVTCKYYNFCPLSLYWIWSCEIFWVIAMLCLSHTNLAPDILGNRKIQQYHICIFFLI